MFKYLTTTLALMTSTATADITLINVFEVPEGQQEATIAAWEVSRDFLAGQPGYSSTSLHAAIAPKTRFQLVNIATWESPEAFKAAVQNMRATGAYPEIKGLGVNPDLHTVIRGE